MKTTISINVDDDIKKYLTEQTNNISQYINDLIRDEMTDKDKRIRRLVRKKERIEDEINRIKDDKDKIEKSKKRKVRKLTAEQKEELENSIKMIEERGKDVMKPRYRRYKNLFDDITFREFRDLIKYYKKYNGK